MGTLLKGAPSGDIRKDVAAAVNLDPASPILDRLEWLGLFSDDVIAITGEETTALDVLSARMLEKMPYKPGERDMIALCHYFTAKFPDGAEEKITSTMIDYGQENGDSSMARTVSLPAAIATNLILTGKMMKPGVHIPVTPDLYNPVLDELATMDIKCVEKTSRA